MATFDYFLKIAGVTGGSLDADHVGEFDALGYEFDLAAAIAAASGGGAGAGKAIFEPLIVDLATTPTLTDLLLKTANGQHIASVTLTVRKAGGTPFDYEIIKLTDVTITSYQEQAGFAPRLALAYRKIEVDLNEQKADGTLGTTHMFDWDLAADGGTIAAPSAGELLPAVQTGGSFDYFLTIPGIDGGSLDARHHDAFDALGYEFDLAGTIAAASGGGGGAGKTSFSPLIVDLAATPGLTDLILKTASGQHIPSLTFAVRKAGGTTDFETIKLSNVSIIGYDEKSGFATRVALAYSKIEVDLVEQNPTGGSPTTHVFSFDLAADGGEIAPPSAGELLPAVQTGGSFDYFLTIPGIDGGTLDVRHPDAFDALGYEFDLAATIAAIGGGAGAGKTTFSPLIVDLEATPTLTDLILKTANGQHIQSLTFAVRKAGGTSDFETIKLSNVTITSYQEQAGFATRVALAYSKIEVDLVEQNPTGGPPTTHVFSWDVLASGGGFAQPSAAQLLPAVQTGGSFDYFLTIPGIDGGTHDARHVDAFDALGYQFDLTATIAAATGGGAGAGKTIFSPLIVDLAQTPTLTDLILKTANGQHIPSLTFAVRKAGGTSDFETVKLFNVSIIGYDEKSGFATRVALAYTKIEVDLVEQSPTGGPPTTHVFSWDLAANGGEIAAPSAGELLPAVQTGGSFDYFLTIPGLDGGTHDARHPDAFDALGYEFDLAATIAAASGGGGGAGKTTFSLLIVDLAATPELTALLLKTANGQHVPSLTFAVRKAGGTSDFETIKLTDVTITSYQEQAGFATRVALVYNKIEVDLVEQNPTGGPGTTHVFSWDVLANGGGFAQPPAHELEPSVQTGSSFDYFLTIPGIKGGTLDARHPDAFDALGYEFDLAATIAAAGGGAGAGKTTFSPLIVDLESSPGLAELLTKEAAGQHIASATFAVRKAGGGASFDFEIIKLSDVTIVSYEDNGGAATRVALAYGKIEIDLIAQKANGTLDTTHVFSWDVTNNEPVINHPPVIDAIASQLLPELPDTTDSATPDTTTVHATFTDPDLSDTGFTAAVTDVVAGGTTGGLALDNAALLALLQPTGVTKDAGVANGTAEFAFSAPDKTFDYLADGQKLTLTYTITVNDNHGGVGTQTATIEIAGNDDAPVFTSPAQFDVAENTTAVGLLTATDPEHDSFTFALAGGDDKSFFGIDAATGALRFLASPDFETPEDANGDNIYDVIVAATDTFGATRTQELSVKVTDVSEPGKVVVGGNGSDTLNGGPGNDVIGAGNGNDKVNAGDGNDVVSGGNGNDALNGGRGDDVMNGDNGDDVLDGGPGKDFVLGGNGEDSLAGGQGNDFLFGDNGKDTLRGGPGDDVLFGGNGPDNFVFGPNFGKDVAADFAKGDVITFEGDVFHDFHDVIAASQQVGANTVITLDAHDTITLLNVSLALLQQKDFAFTH